jgi:hypothetical protein
MGFAISSLCYLYYTYIIYFGYYVLIESSLIYTLSFIGVGICLWYSLYKSYKTDPGFLPNSMALKKEVKIFLLILTEKR